MANMTERVDDRDKKLPEGWHLSFKGVYGVYKGINCSIYEREDGYDIWFLTEPQAFTENPSVLKAIQLAQEKIDEWLEDTCFFLLLENSQGD